MFNFYKVLLFCGFCFVGTTQAQAVLSYDFNGNYSDTFGNGVNISHTNGTITSNSYQFHYVDNYTLSLENIITSSAEYFVEYSLWADGNNAFSVDLFSIPKSGGALPGSITLTYLKNYWSENNYITTNTSFSWSTSTVFGLSRTLNGQVNIYVNGNLLGGFMDSNGRFILDPSLGRRLLVGGSSWVGKIDYVRVYNSKADLLGVRSLTAPIPTTPTTNVSIPWNIVGVLTIFGLLMVRLKKNNYRIST